MEFRSRRRRRRGEKYALYGALLVVAVAAALAAPRVWSWGVEKYRGAKQHRALEQARRFVSDKDAAGTSTALEVALTSRPGNLEAWRVAADLVEQLGARDAIQFRRRVVSLDPGNASHRLALARTALRFQDFATALECFGNLSPEARSSPEGVQLTLALSLIGQAAPVADAIYAELEKKAPGDESLVFSRAVLRLRHPVGKKAEVARAEVEKFSSRPAYRLTALRELFLDAVARAERPRALETGRRLVESQGATLGDKLSVENAALRWGGHRLDDVRGELARAALGSAADAVQFATWLMIQGRDKEARTWIEELPPALAKAPEVAALRADWALRDADWDGLQRLLRAGAWGRVSPEVVQLAISTRLIGSNENQALRARLWTEAVKVAGADLASLGLLHRLAAAWAWPNETLAALAAIAGQFPAQVWAHDARVTLCRRLEDTAGMLAALQDWRRADPVSERLRYNAALLEALTTSTTLPDEALAKQDLESLHAAHPDNATYLTGAAFALAKAGHTHEAVDLLDGLPGAEAMLPARAPYLAYVFAAGNRPERAALYLAAAKPAELLPEERTLLAFAQFRVDNPPVIPGVKSKPAGR